MDPTRAILVADRWFGKRLKDIAEGSPIWIVDSPANRAGVAARLEHSRGSGDPEAVTLYRDTFQLSPPDAAAQAIGSVVAKYAGVSHLTIIGVPLSPALVATLSSFGFALESEGGLEFRFVRDLSAPPRSLDTTVALARIIATSDQRRPAKAEDRSWWFAQRKVLPGWGPPVCWQGWAVMIGYFILLAGPAPFLARSIGAHYLGYVLVLTLAFLGVVVAKGEPFR